MADVTTQDNAISTGRNRWQGWQQKWAQSYYKPLTDATIKLWMQQQPPEVIAKLKELAPAAMKNLQERLK